MRVEKKAVLKDKGTDSDKGKAGPCGVRQWKRGILKRGSGKSFGNLKQKKLPI